MGQSTHKAENQETLIQRCSAEYLSFQIETNFDMSAASKLQHIRRAITSARSANLKKSWTILQEEEAFLPETRLPKISASILSHSYHSHWKVLFPRGLSPWALWHRVSPGLPRLSLLHRTYVALTFRSNVLSPRVLWPAGTFSGFHFLQRSCPKILH